MDNEKTIWNFLMSKIGNAYGVAGLMGNLYAESRLDPGLLESSYARKFGITSAEYVKKVDNGTYDNFVHDSAGFGLAQWTYWSRKESFLNFMKSRKVSIADLNMQLVFLDDEIRKYKTVFNTLLTAKSVREASDIVMSKYEKNSNQSEDNKARRAEFGQRYFDKYSNKKVVEVISNIVNIRYGNDISYPSVGVALMGDRFDYVVTSDNGWNAIVFGDRVAWISGDYCKVVNQ